MGAGFCHTPVAYCWVSLSTNRFGVDRYRPDRRRDHVRLLTPCRGYGGTRFERLGGGARRRRPVRSFFATSPRPGEAKPRSDSRSEHPIQDTERVVKVVKISGRPVFGDQ